jgi:hypothetical protein
MAYPPHLPWRRLHFVDARSVKPRCLATIAYVLGAKAAKP